jgi:hypothetical protein
MFLFGVFISSKEHFSFKVHFWMILVILTSTLSYLVNFMRYTIIINKHSISFQGIFVIFLSVLFRLSSFLIFMIILISLIFNSNESGTWYWSVLFFFFLLLQEATSLFFTQQKLYAKSFTGYLFAFWTSIVGNKKYVYCFPKLFYTKKVMYKFNLSKVTWTFWVLFKFILYSILVIIITFAFVLDEFPPEFPPESLPVLHAVLLILIIVLFSELLPHFLRFVYYKFCHVWKDILPAKHHKRNLNIFSSELEIISNKEGNTPLLTRNLP